MAKEMTNKHDTACRQPLGHAESQALGIDVLARLNQPAFEIMRDINERALAQMTEAHNIWLRFIQRRLACDVELPSALARCKTPQDVIRVYAEFVQTAAQHYQEEIADVTRLGQAFGNEAAEIVRDAAERTQRDLTVH